VNANFGNIATEVRFTENGTGVSANVTEPRSAAGAAWQNSLFYLDPQSDQLLVLNQGAGNTDGYQWGYRVPVGSDLNTTNWIPAWTDHAHSHFSTQPFADAFVVPHSPCTNMGYLLDDILPSLSAHVMPTAAGNLLNVTDRISVRPRLNETWMLWRSEQAFYLDRQVAKSDNARIYLKGKSGWMEGPIIPYQDYRVVHTAGATSTCTNGSCDAEISIDLDYALIVWTVGKTDIGMIIKALGNGGDLVGKSSGTYCSDSSNAACGMLAWHTWLSPEIRPATFSAGQISSYSVDYIIGTLADLGASNPDVAALVTADKPSLPNGLFIVGPAVYYAASGDAHYCHVPNVPYLNGRFDNPDISQIPIMSSLPSGISDGDCVIPPGPFIAPLVDNPTQQAIYFSSGATYCHIPTMQFMAQNYGIQTTAVFKTYPQTPSNMTYLGGCTAQ
jgi:hypothetical protein